MNRATIKRLLLTLVVGGCFAVAATAQKAVVSGRVTDDGGEPIVSATVLAYADSLLNSENSLEQSAIVEADSLQGLLALRMEENLYFRRSAWVTHYTRFYYELIFTIADGSFNVEMRRIHYLYEEEAVERTSSFTAEEWITDEEALSKDGKKLTRISGRFRRATIDRKDEIFRGAGLATGAIRKRKVVQVIETEE